MTLEELQIKFTADVAGLNTELNDVKKAVGGIEAPTQKAGGAFAGLAKIGGAIAAAGIATQLVSIGKESLMMANDVAESESLFEVSMGDMADSAREWSKELADSLGVSEYGARKNVGVLNTMFKSMGLGKNEASSMAKELTMLSEDMASFYNLDPTEAFTKLQAGITGEAEGLKRLGILVDEQTVQQYALRKGIIKQGQAMTNQQKVQARYGAILEQTGDAQGDLARTMESPTNQLRKLSNEMDNAKIALGTALQPALLAILPVLTGLANGATDVINSFGGMFSKTAKDSFEGIALSLEEARAYVADNVDSTLVQLAKDLEAADARAQDAFAAFETAENLFKEVNTTITVNEPTTTGAERIKAAVDGIETEFLEYKATMIKPIEAILAARLSSGEISQAQYDREIKRLNGRFQRTDGLIKGLVKTIDGKINAALTDGEVTLSEAADVEGAIDKKAAEIIAGIQAEAVAQEKQIDIWLKQGVITQAVGVNLKEQTRLKAEEMIGAVEAQVTLAKIELGSLNWNEVTFSIADAEAMHTAINNAVDAQVSSVDAYVEKANILWSDAGEIGLQMDAMYSGIQEKVNAKAAELRALTSGWIDGAAPTAEDWEKAKAIKDEIDEMTAFMFADNSKQGAVITAAFDGSGVLSSSGIKNMMTAFNEYVVQETETSKNLLNQRIGDMMKMSDERFAVEFPDMTLDEAVAKLTADMAAQLTLEKNGTLMTAAKALLPSIGAAISSGDLNTADLTGFSEQIATMLNAIDVSALDEKGKEMVSQIINGFNDPSVLSKFDGINPLLALLSPQYAELSAQAAQGAQDAWIAFTGTTEYILGTGAIDTTTAAMRNLGDKAMSELEDAVVSGKIEPHVYDRAVLHAAYGTLQELADSMRNGGDEAGAQFIEGIIAKQEAARQAAAGLKNAAKEGAAGDAGANSAGSNFGQGFANGITSKLATVRKAAQALAGAAGGAMRLTLQEQSPSKVTREIGGYFGEGFVIGMQDMAGAIYKTSAGLADDAVAGVRGAQGTIGLGVSAMGNVGVASAVTAGMQGLVDALNIQLLVDGEQFGRVALRTINDTQRRAGQFLLGVG